MKTVMFFEKPGCIGNAKQKALLTREGFTLEVHSILSTPWTPETLRPFFGTRPVAEWFNRTAPSVKNGLINPDALSESEALTAMIKEPLLISRPLISYNGKKACGFDQSVQHELLGLPTPDAGIEACANPTNVACTPQ